jgi:hypothetical protein
MRMDTLHNSRPPALLAGPLDTRLITTQKPSAGIRPIAVQEVWIYLFAFSTIVGIVRCIEKLLIACSSMSYDSYYDAL